MEWKELKYNALDGIGDYYIYLDSGGTKVGLKQKKSDAPENINKGGTRSTFL